MPDVRLERLPGQAGHGVKGATIHDVARAAKVSVATVSRTLNGPQCVATGTRERVMRAVLELDYVPNSGARALSTRCTDTIGVLLPDLHGEFFSELIRGIDLAARSRGLHLLLSSSHGDPEEAAAALRAMRSRVDGRIAMFPEAGTGVADHTERDVATVFIGSGQRAGQVCLEIDNHSGALTLTRHLVATGRRRLAFVAGPRGNREAQERERGYRQAVAEAGLEPRVVPGDFTEEAGAKAASLIVAEDWADAIFCANDMMALGCLNGLRSAGKIVPDDVALAGFDDIPIARYVSPPLTTAAVPIAEIGRTALECCADLIAGREPQTNRMFEPKLIVRASTTASFRTLEG